MLIAASWVMFEIRVHGRAGQGVKLASRIIGRAGFLAGLFAQVFLCSARSVKERRLLPQPGLAMRPPKFAGLRRNRIWLSYWVLPC